MRILVAALCGLFLLFTLAAGEATASAGNDTFPLPNGFQPEGIAIGPDGMAYFGSRADGSIHRIDLRSGAGAAFSEGPGTPSLGLTIHRGRLIVAGGTGGDARVIDTADGAVLARHKLSEVPAFVNDVIVYRGSAWFTDSHNPVLYRLPLKGKAPERVALSGDIEYQDGINANGIVPTPDGRGLLIVQSNTGLLFRVNPWNGDTRAVDLGGETLPFGDGLLRRGRTLYVVQNRPNQVAVLTVNARGTAGKVERRVSDPRFDTPTTVDAFAHRLYLPNARFTTDPTPDTPYNVISIPRP